MKPEIKYEKRIRRHKMIRSKAHGTAKRPRLCVFRSLKHMYAQLVDDDKNKILACVSDFEVKKKTAKDAKTGTKVSLSLEVGKLIAQEAKDLKIDSVIFDRAGFVYHGRIKAVADGAREAGLKF